MSLSTLLQRAERVLSRERGAVVLAYHRVASVASDPQRLAVHPDRFESHLEVLKRDATPLTLEQALNLAAVGQLPERAVAVTFDDGYADVLSNAAPALASRSMPSTVFVTTGAIAANTLFWWDRVEQLLLAPGTIDERVTLVIGTERVEYRFDGAARYTREDYNDHCAWHVEVAGSPTPRHHAYRDLCARLRVVDPLTCAQAIDQLAARVQLDDVVGVGRPMTIDDVRALARVSGVTIGSHTVSHSSLAHLNSHQQFEEIDAARAQLATWLGLAVTSFAYPFGGDGDVNATTESAARRAGIDLACTTRGGVVGRSTGRLRVPRLIVRDWTRDEFARRLHAWVTA